MKTVFLGLSLSLSMFSLSSFGQPHQNTISSTIPNKEYFVQQCAGNPKISVKYEYKPLMVTHLSFDDPIWGQYQNHPLSTSLISLSAKTNTNVFTKYNSPDYCSYATTIDIVVEVIPVIAQLFSLNNSFFQCLNDELKKREEKNMSYHLQKFNQDKSLLDLQLKNLEKEILTLYSTTNQSKYYNSSISKQIQSVFNKFDYTQPEFIHLNNQLNKVRNYSSLCPQDKDYLDQFLLSQKSQKQ